MYKRYLTNFIIKDAIASNKIAVITGPRQCGKTTIAKQILENLKQNNNYFNWDDDEFKKLWIRSPKEVVNKISAPILNSKPIIVLDELHKHNKWKNSLKGLYDIYGDKIGIIVTGSARLDYYKKSGDSLAGRYIPYRLHPFSIGEKAEIKLPPEKDWFANESYAFDWNDIFNLGGFPEPLISGSEQKAVRWRRIYRERILKEDTRDLRMIKDVNTLEAMALLLTDKIGSPLSINSIKEDLKISFSTAQQWLGILCALYYSFIIRPYSKKIKRSISKEPKLYLYDWGGIKDDGIRLENMVACHLLKACNLWTDAAIGEFELFYIRDKEKREVDFFVTRDNNPYLMVEVKTGNNNVSPSLIKYSEMLKPRFVFQVVTNKKDEKKDISSGIILIEAQRFLAALP